MSLEDDIEYMSEHEFDDLPMREVRFVVDQYDYDAIQNAIAQRQTMRADGKLIIPAGKGDLGGRLLAEVCRGWGSLIDQFRKK